jgi:hypothetical protein
MKTNINKIHNFRQWAASNYSSNTKCGRMVWDITRVTSTKPQNVTCKQCNRGTK